MLKCYLQAKRQFTLFFRTQILLGTFLCTRLFLVYLAPFQFNIICDRNGEKRVEVYSFADVQCVKPDKY